MSVVLILILASLTVATGFLLAFVWAVRSGQYEDLSTPSLRMLADDTTTRSTPSDPATQLNSAPAHER
jgi:cbb3-type cytochrome oxidase maturation protein